MSQSPRNDSSRQNISDSQTIIDSLSQTIEELQIALKLIQKSDNTSYSANPSIVKKLADSTAKLVTSLDGNSVTEIPFDSQPDKLTQAEEIDIDDDDWGGLITENEQKELPSFTPVKQENFSSTKKPKIHKKSRNKNRLLTILLAIFTIIIIISLGWWLYQNNQKNLLPDDVNSELESTIFNNVTIDQEGIKLRAYPEIESDFDSAEIVLTEEKKIDLNSDHNNNIEPTTNQFYSAINESPVQENFNQLDNNQLTKEKNNSVELSENQTEEITKKPEETKQLHLESDTLTKSGNSVENELNLQVEKNNQEPVITALDSINLEENNDQENNEDNNIFYLSPEQMLVQNIEDKVKEITNQFGDNLIAGVKADFRQNYLLIIVKQQWYNLAHTQQDKLVEIVFSQAKILDFDRFEVEDINHNLVARNAVVGNNILVISR